MVLCNVIARPVFWILIILLIPSSILFQDLSYRGAESRNSLMDNLNLSYQKFSTLQQSPPKVMRYLDHPKFNNNPLNYDTLTNPSTPASFMFDTLVEFDFGTGELIPVLAKYWVVSNNSKHWFFTLREDVWFHDGTKFNATVVKYNFDRLFNPAHPAYTPNSTLELINGKIPLESIRIINDYEIVFNLYEPFSPFITNIVSSLELLAPHSFSGPNVTNPIGTGPYKLEEEIFFDNRVVLNFSRNTAYFRGTPPFEEIQYILYWEFEDWKLAVLSKAGDLTSINMGIAGVYGEIEALPTYWEYLSISNAIELGWLNQRRVEFTIPKVRQALNYAVDKVNYLPFSYNQSVSHSIFPENLTFFDPSIPGYPYNVEKANQLLNEAGFPKKEDGYRFDLQFTGPAGRETRYEVIMADLEAAGIRCELVTVSWEEYERILFEKDFDITVVGWEIQAPSPNCMQLFLHSSGELNFGGYASPEMDKALINARTTPVRQEQEYYYKLVQSIAQEEAPYLLLQDWSRKHFRARHIAPFVTIQPNGRIGFNYSLPEQFPLNFHVNDFPSSETPLNNPKINILANPEIYTYEDVQVANYSLYFPYVDAIFTNLGSKDGLIFNVRMSYEFQSFSSTHKDRGKFYEIKTNLVNGEYRFRCYYNPPEVEGFIVDHLYEFDNNSNSWISLETRASNISLRFIEVHLKGEYKLLRVGEAILHATYTFLPFILLVLGTVVSLGTTTILINRHMINQIKERFIFH